MQHEAGYLSNKKLWYSIVCKNRILPSGLKALSKMLWSEITNLKQTDHWLKALRDRIWRKGIIIEYRVSVQLSEFGHPTIFISCEYPFKNCNQIWLIPSVIRCCSPHLNPVHIMQTYFSHIRTYLMSTVPHFLFSYLLLGCLDTKVSNVRILGKNKILVEKT
jgi:hypothetical protein